MKVKAQRYDEWAETYEADLDRDFGWCGPIRAVESTIRYVKKDCCILDARAGTGLVGKLLTKRGSDNLVAMDLSAGMLEEARKKNIYTDFYQVIMGTPPLKFPSDCFDAGISVGVLTVGDAPANSYSSIAMYLI